MESDTSTVNTGPVTAEQFRDFALMTHWLLAVLVLLVGVYVLGTLGVWARRG